MQMKRSMIMDNNQPAAQLPDQTLSTRGEKKTQGGTNSLAAFNLPPCASAI
jgi:hypothetical protein